MENRNKTSTQQARNTMNKAAREIQTALQYMQRGNANQSASHFGRGFQAMFQTMDELAQVIDRLDQEKNQ